ncbi:hypothetical protein BKA65DRAFT_154296 [Rhexocercosporidium sp. MPI-PUGE-AT-0058]|nr:hypothetical protein BKA65DRAFT_154296 [Rhexocercosporidium sp. MPI-PUGE-AT-0058]
MRSLFNALALLPAVAIVSAVPFVPDDQVDQEWDRRALATPITENSPFANIDLDIKSTSPDVDSTTLRFRVDVLNSETPCGFGNVTIDGTVLPQTVDGDVSTGKGSVSSNTKGVVVGSWSFHCITVNGIPDAQLLKFTVDFVDGKAMEDAGFSMLFRQSGLTEIMNIETDLSIPDEVVANPNPMAFRPDYGTLNHRPGIENDMAELDYLWSQLREIKYLIHQKERSIQADLHRAIDIKDCDSVKCVVQAMAHRAKHAAFDLYDKISGDDEEGRYRHHRPKGSFREFRGRKGGNHTHQGNHTHHLPPWKRPHSRPLPICRYPSPPPRGNNRPNNHGPPPPPPPRFDGPPPHHHMPHPPPEFDEPPHHGASHRDGPDFDQLPHHGHDDRPEFDGHFPHHGPPDFYHSPPPPPPDFDSPTPPPPPSPPHDHEGPPPAEAFPPHRPPPPGPHRHPNRHVGRALQVIKFTTVGFLFAFLLTALHRRVCAPNRRADRHERRRRRRALRRAVHKHKITRLLARMAGSGSDSNDEEEFEEKFERHRLLMDAEDGMSVTMSEDLEQLRNAAEVVGEIVAVEQQQQHQPFLPTRTTPAPSPALVPAPEQVNVPVALDVVSPMPPFEEELPAYDDTDGSDLSSVVSDGYRPGTLYTPSQSPSGSLSDILGPDRKS